jgi:hypothetical protein
MEGMGMGDGCKISVSMTLLLTHTSADILLPDAVELEHY